MLAQINFYDKFVKFGRFMVRKPQSSHHPQEVLLAQFSLYVHKGGLKPDSFHFYGA